MILKKSIKTNWKSNTRTVEDYFSTPRRRKGIFFFPFLLISKPTRRALCCGDRGRSSGWTKQKQKGETKKLWRRKSIKLYLFRWNGKGIFCSLHHHHHCHRRTKSIALRAIGLCEWKWECGTESDINRNGRTIKSSLIWLVSIWMGKNEKRTRLLLNNRMVW